MACRSIFDRYAFVVTQLAVHPTSSGLKNFWETHMQRGALASLLMVACATIVLAASAVVGSGDLYFATGFGGLGLLFTWREYVLWRRRREQKGIELLGTSENVLGR